jgi:ABC-type branched-subunit amino acid transport system permease subunit
MENFITGTLTAGEWIVVAGSAALLLLWLLPVLWACWLFVNMTDGAVDDAIRDAQRLAVVKNRVRGDLP